MDSFQGARSKVQIKDRKDAGELLFLTAKGNMLVSNQLVDGKLKRSDSISCLFRRLMKEVGLNEGRSFYSLRKTGATLIEQIDQSATEMYLAHSERGMKRNYAERNWGALGTALMKLEKRLGFPPQCSAPTTAS